jgi:hypothetical protein
MEFMGCKRNEYFKRRSKKPILKELTDEFLIFIGS